MCFYAHFWLFLFSLCSFDSAVSFIPLFSSVLLLSPMFPVSSVLCLKSSLDVILCVVFPLVCFIKDCHFEFTPTSPRLLARRSCEVTCVCCQIDDVFFNLHVLFNLQSVEISRLPYTTAHMCVQLKSSRYKHSTISVLLTCACR